jgi:hypothetical protein
MSKKTPDSFQNSNAVGLLKHFTKDEMREFEKFIESPFHNNRSDVGRFYKEVKKYYPAFSGESFTKEKIFEKLYPGKKYRDDVMRRLSSNLFKAGEEFAGYITGKKDLFNRQKNILDFYSGKNSDRHFAKQLKKVNESLEENPVKDSEYFYNKSLLNEIERLYYLKDDPTYKRSGFEEQITNLWKFSLTSLLRLYGFAEFETFFFNKNYDLRYSKSLLEIAESSCYMGSKAVEIYSLAIKLYGKEKSGEAFNRLKDAIEENLGIFTKPEAFSLYIHLINYCNIHALNPERDYTYIKFELVKKMHERGLIAAGGVIDPGWFRGVFMMAFNAGEINFAEKFVEEYKRMIAGEDAGAVINHVYAQLALHKNNYEEALKYLSTASYRHINDKMTIKFVYLKIYYEMNDFEQFLYCADSLKHLIKEEGSFSENIAAPIRSFINHSTKIFRAKLKEINTSPGELKHEVIKSKTIMRKWLLEKADEIK